MHRILDALSSNFIRNILRLTSALVRKYPPLSISTSFGHLDTLRQGIASTRKLPSPLALGLSRRDRRRSLFLDDVDDHDAETEDAPSLSLPRSSLSVRRSSRLALPTSDYSRVSTVHRSEWTASDLTGRFPIPSYDGDEYILITVHLGCIHYLPLRSCTSASYVSAFRKVFAFFKSKSFPVTHLILDNESSTALVTFLQSTIESHQFVPPINIAPTVPNMPSARVRITSYPCCRPSIFLSPPTVGLPCYP